MCIRDSHGSSVGHHSAGIQYWAKLGAGWFSAQ
jgi:hypothetical protein